MYLALIGGSVILNMILLFFLYLMDRKVKKLEDRYKELYNVD